MKKSSSSGILLGPVCQYVGSPVDIHEQLQFVIDCSRFLPFGVVNLEPQLVCLAIPVSSRYKFVSKMTEKKNL